MRLKADDQTDASEKLGHDGEEGQGRRDSHHVGKESHGAGVAVSAKPAEGFLGAVGEEDDSGSEAENGQGKVAGIRVSEFFEHWVFLS